MSQPEDPAPVPAPVPSPVPGASTLPRHRGVRRISLHGYQPEPALLEQVLGNVQELAREALRARATPTGDSSTREGL